MCGDAGVRGTGLGADERDLQSVGCDRRHKQSCRCIGRAMWAGIVVGFGDQEPSGGSNAGLAITKNASAFTDAGVLSDQTEDSLSLGGGVSPVIGC